jgi:alanine racemase
MNESQRLSFETIRQHFPFALASLANSGGVFLGPQYHYNMVRAGLALTGCRTAVPLDSPSLKPALKAYAQVLQIRDVPRGESIGYDATFITSRASRIATLGVGYGDGYLRCLSNQGDVYFEGQKLPLVGRVSMDLLTVDATDVPPNKINPGDWVELFGDHLFIDTVAEKAGTISWELMTRLGPRFERFYLDAKAVKDVA